MLDNIIIEIKPYQLSKKYVNLRFIIFKSKIKHIIFELKISRIKFEKSILNLYFVMK